MRKRYSEGLPDWRSVEVLLVVPYLLAILCKQCSDKAIECQHFWFCGLTIADYKYAHF